MIEPSEILYIETKLYKQGKKKLNEEYYQLAKWIERKFNVTVINILLDKINEDTPRLNVIFEHFHDENKMLDENNLNFDTKYQNEISEKFISITGIGKGEYIFVCYHSFSPVAIIEANSNIFTSELINLKDKYTNNNVWEIYRVFGSVTVFFYNNTQIIENERNGVSQKIKNDYYDLIKKYDEFDYVNKNTLDIRFDSKQNLDDNYEGSFFYFFR